MIRILLWRIGQEYWHLVALLLQTPLASLLKRYCEPVGYFAFGANLDPQVLLRRRTRPLAAEEILLRDHELVFNQPGPFEGFGFASAESSPGNFVYGKIYQIRRVDAKRMDYFELVPLLHRHRRVEAEQDGAEFFFYRTSDPRDGLRPSQEYLDKILVAANRSAIIPQEYLADLRATPTLEVFEWRREPNFLFRDYGQHRFLPAKLLRHYDLLSIRLLRASFRIWSLNRLIRA